MPPFLRHDMRRFVAFLVVVVVLSGGVQAAKVTADAAAIVARNFMAQQGVETQFTVEECGLEEMYLFVGADGGFVLVAGDDCVHPILGYSLTARVAAQLPENMIDWVKGYAEEIASLRARGAVASQQVRAEWDALLKAASGSPSYTVVVQPMITTTWKQGSPYNTLCPHDSLNRETKAGCVAIAMAQVMRYWNHPTRGVGNYSYSNANNGTVSANFGATTYAWNSMPNSISSSSSLGNIDAVATLVYHAGVSVKMSYGYSSSGATTTSSNNLNTITAEYALRTYFKYDKALHSVSRDAVGDSVWKALLDVELVEHRPVIISGHDVSGGHAFICDGSNSADLYHINWGWGGYCDGYYRIGALNPAPGGDGGNATSHYNLGNKMIVGIQPDTVLSGTYTLTALPDDASHGSVTGGGSHAYGDTVVLTALANTSHRFNRWSDGMCYNSRNLIMSGNRTLYAIYDSVQGDTLRFDNGVYVTSWGYSTAQPFYWGIKIDPTLLAGHDFLEAVQAYFKVGTYRLMVYAGAAPSASTLFDSMSFSATAEGWKTLALGSALAVDATRPLWIVLYNDDITYPACAGVYCGHQQAAYANTNGTSWDVSTSKRTFLIRGIFYTPQPQPYYDTLVVDACDRYSWQGTTFYTSGTYVRRYETVEGADSVKVLVLTIHRSYRHTENVTTDSAYTWVDGQVYDVSGTYTIDTVTVYGCDSVLTLVLTVNSQPLGVESAEGHVVLVFPNPATGVITILGGEVETVKVYDGAGVCVVSVEHEAQVDLTFLPAGVYAVRVRFAGGHCETFRVLKQ